MKVIFLDFDGVIWTARASIAHREETSVLDGFDPVAIALVIKAAITTGAKIVISSTWRGHGKESILEDLENFCQDLEDFLHEDWRTASIKGAVRGQEVEEWLSRHPEVTQYACVDDDSDFLPNQTLIQTDTINGFSLQNYDKLTEVLRDQK